MPDRATARRQLDARIAPWRSLTYERPHRGWIRALRDALGMSSTELATRMSVSQSRIPEIERGEVAGSLRLSTLERAADALGCELVYALVPRKPLDETVHERARQTAGARLAAIRHSMRLEDQTVGADDTEQLIGELADDLVDRRGLWTDAPTRA
jgi:predicted DNA-binding mobile mystery protein A